MAVRQGQARRSSQVGWVIALIVSALVLAYGIFLFITGPEMVLENISERTSLGADGFRVGSPSALDVMSVVVRQTASFAVAVGSMAIIAGWWAYRTGSRWAWALMWGVPAALAGTGVGFVLASGIGPQAVMFLGAAAVVAVALLVARRGLAA